MIRFLLIIFSTAFSVFSFIAQQNLMIITSNVQNGLTVCENTVSFSVTIENPSPFDINNPSVVIDLPLGVNYVLGSNNNCTESNVTNLSQPEFTIPNVVSLQNPNYTFSILLEANCEVEDFLLNGGNLENTVSIDYDATNGTNTLTNQNQTHTSSGYNIQIPNLSLVSISNQAYSGVVGDVFSRCITLVNGGDGSLSVFSVLDEHSPSISINNISIGSQSPVPNGNLYNLTAADFIANPHPSSNGDSFFDPGETIEICETVEILACTDASSDLSYWWGCGTDTCQILTDAANVTFPGQVPQLQFTASNSYQRNGALNNMWQGAMNLNCYGNNGTGDFESGLEITNSGTGTAYQIELEVFQGWNTNMVASMYSSLNTTSFQVYRNGVLEGTINFDSLTNAQNKPCLPASPVGQVFFTLDSLAPNDTFFITWNHYTCCYNICANNERRHLLAWRYRGNYRNSCFDDYTIPLATGSAVSYFRNQQVLDASPGTLLGSSSGTLSFLTQSYEFVIPRTTGNDLFYYQVILPPCLSYDAGSVVMRDEDGVIIPTNALDSIIVYPSATGDTINMYSSAYGQVGGVQHTLSFDVSLDCNNCSATGLQSIQFNSFYVPDLDCGCVIQQACITEDIELQCPLTCEGANLVGAEAVRENYGSPDNDNDGYPDAAGNLDFSLVKTNRLMYGDTLKITTTSYIENPNNLLFNRFFAQTDIKDIGTNFSYDRGNLIIYDASLGIYYTCNNVTGIMTVTDNANDRSFVNDIDLTTNPCITNPTLETGDSVFWEGYYHVDNNIGGNISAGQAENYSFVSSVPYVIPVDSTTIYGCNKISRNVILVGYYWTNYGPNDWVMSNCDTITLTQNYYLSIGPCCSNYAGGNLFPFEYRYWGHPDTLTITLPDDYTYIDSRFNFRRTTGTLNSAVSPWFNITPVMPINNNVYPFVTEPFFGPDQVNDSIFHGDDGWYGTIQMRIAANCNVADSVGRIRYDWKFSQIPQLATSNTAPQRSVNNNDEVTYQAPQLNLQSNLVSVNSNTGQEQWTLTLTNNSFISSGSFGWIGAPSSVGITADSIYDNTNNTVIYPNANGIFSVGDIPPNSANTYTLYTTMTNCNPDSILVYYGWGCQGVPVDVPSYECDAEFIKLSITPLFPELGNTINSTVGDTINLCENVIYEVEVRNFQLGNAYNVLARINLPPGMTLIPGSSQFSYGGPFNPIPDPNLITGTVYEYDVNSLNVLTLQDGLPGIYDPQNNSFLIRFEVSTGCDYESGSRVLTQSFGESFCGENRTSIPELSNQLFIADALPPYASEIGLDIDFITPCAGGSIVNVFVINNGPQATSVNDSVTIDLYPGTTYAPNSFVAGTNGPLASSFSDTVYNNHQYVSWHMPSGVAPGDSVQFQINIDADEEALECGITQIGAFATTSGSSLCNATACNISVVTGDTVRNIFVYKSYLELFNGSATSIPNPPTGETVSVDFEIGNNGETVIAGTPTVIQFYDDTDNNGGLSGGDTYLTSDTIFSQINSNDTILYSNTMDFNSPYTCNVIAVIDTALNPCVCTPQQITIPISLLPPNDTVMVCSNEQVTIGLDSISGYNYNWQNPTNLDNPNLASPIFTAPTVLSPNIDSLSYVREIVKLGCQTTDTSLVIIYPNPIADAGLDDTICASSTLNLNGNPFLSHEYGWWSLDASFANPSTVTFSNDSINNPSVSGFTSGSYSFVWSVSNGVCVESTDTVMITVLPVPLANAGADQDLCAVYTTILDGNIPAGTSTGMWTVDLSANNPSAVTFADSSLSNTSISNLQEGTYTLLWTVTNGVCADDVDTVLINVYDQPTSSAGDDQDLCNIYTTALSGNAPIGTSQGVWTEDVNYGNPSAVNFIDDSLNNTVVSGLIEGNYALIWTVSNGTCPAANDTVLINIYDRPIANAGVDIDLCDTYNVQLDANSPVGSSTGIWSEVGINPSIVNIVQPTVYNSSIGNLVEGTYQMQWTVSNGNCPDEIDTVAINVYDAPTANAGTDQELCNIYTTTLDGNLPLGTATGVWSENTAANNPSVVNFVDPTLNNTDISNLVEGTYSLIWTVSNGNCADVSDTVLITVYDQPIATLGPDIYLCDTNAVILSGQGVIGTATGAWSLDASVINPTGSNFNPVNDPQTLLENIVVGSYNVVWTVSNGSCPSDSDTLTVINQELPIAIINNPAEQCDNLCFDITSLSTAPNGETITDIDWSIDGNAYSNATEEICITEMGIYDIQLVVTASNGCLSDTANSFITINPSPVASFLIDPSDSVFLTETINIVHTGSDDVTLSTFTMGSGDTLTGFDVNYLYADTGQYYIEQIVVNQFDCYDTVGLEYLVNENLFLYIPNAFSPNNDGVNDIFKPVISQTDIVDITFLIFDRWGNLILEDEDIDVAWDGTFKSEPAPQDVYVWKMTYRLARSNAFKTITGHVTLIR